MTKKDYNRLRELQGHTNLFMTSAEFERYYQGAYRWDKKEQTPEYNEVNGILTKELDGFGQFYNFCLQLPKEKHKAQYKIMFVRCSMNYNYGTDMGPFYEVAYIPLTDFLPKEEIPF
jgi:hypothetical protein